MFAFSNDFKLSVVIIKYLLFGAILPMIFLHLHLRHLFSCVTGLLLAGLGLSWHAVAADLELTPAIEFFAPEKLSRVVLSPDGKNIAVIMLDKEYRYTMFVRPVDGTEQTVLAHFADADVADVHWVNNKRLVYTRVDAHSVAGEGSVSPGLFSVDINGKNRRELIATGSPVNVPKNRVLTAGFHSYHAFHRTIPEKDTDDIYVAKINLNSTRRGNSSELIRLNTTDGATVTINAPGKVIKWLIDVRGEPRIATTFDDGRLVTFLREPDGSWRKLFESDAMADDGIQPEFFGPGNQLYASALKNGNLRQLYLYDLANRRLSSEPVFELDGFDYNGGPIMPRSSKTILGFYYETDAPNTLWLTPEYQALQAKVDSELSGRVNRISLPEEGGNGIVLIRSFSDVDPGSWHLYNSKTGEETFLGNVRPHSTPALNAAMDFLTFQARDGARIPVYLTLPKRQQKKLPMVVLVHGGPNIRGGHWRWNAEVQFLASRGYAVLQPEFRGSTGYGLKHFAAGWKQWGLRMQDDVTDATKWAISSGIADPARICIAGASYGGYASLWGLIKEPDLYQCAISWVGVTDLSYLYSIAWSDSTEDADKYFLPKTVGDKNADAAQFKSTSVVENADKLKKPLLLAYGGEDQRVPLEHGKRLMKAINNPSNVEWVVYQNEGHGWSSVKTNLDFWTRAERLLARTLRPAPSDKAAQSSLAP